MEGDWRKCKFSFIPESAGSVTLSIMGENSRSKDDRGWIAISGLMVDGNPIANSDFAKTTVKNGKPVPDGFTLNGGASHVAGGGPNGSGAVLVNHDNQLSYNLKVEGGRPVTIEFMSKAAYIAEQTATAGFLKLIPNGIEVKVGAFDTVLSYPQYNYGKNRLHAKAKIAPDGQSAVLEYDEPDRLIDCRIEDNTVIFNYGKTGVETGKPPVELRLMQDFCYNGASWRFNNPWDFQGEAESVFPTERAEKWFSFSGFAESCTISVADGKGDKLTLHSKSQYYMKDERLWRYWFTLTCFPDDWDGESWIAFTFKKGDKTAALLDRFGQFINVDFADKVRDEAELRSDVPKDEAYYASFPELERSFWGGLPGSKEKYGFKATGFFHLEKWNGREVLVDPEGNLYFHLGICGMNAGGIDTTCVAGREGLFEWLPEKSGKFSQAWRGQQRIAVSFYLANYIRKFGAYDAAEWQKRMIDRMRSWGFNAFGEFTWIAGDNDKSGFAITHCLEHYAKRQPFHLITKDFIDPYDEYNFPLLEKDFAQKTAPWKGKPMLIGYYTENERHYNVVLPALLALPKEIPAKRKFAEMMKQRYQNDIAGFNEAWGAKWNHFNDVASHAMPEPRTARGEADAAAFEHVFFDDYYKLIRSTLKKADPDHLYLGERLLPAQTYHEAAVKALAKYCDIFSVNYYVNEYDPKDIERYARITGRPLLLSEWSFGSPEQGLFGCRNKTNDDERGKAYRRYAENAMASPHVVGVQWYALLDEPNTGRGYTTVGERYNMGFLNVCDRPFKKLISHAYAANSNLYELMSGTVKPVLPHTGQSTVAEEQTLLIGKVKPGIAVTALRDKYPGRPGELINRSVAGVSPKSTDSADMICGWDEQYLYILLTVVDDTPATNTHRRPIWMGDCVEIFVGADPKADGKMKATDRQLGIRVNTEANPDMRWDCNGIGVETSTRPQTCVRIASDRKSYSMEIAFPWKEVGITPRPGLKFRFDVAINFNGASHDVQGNKLVWNGLENNYFQRGLWGTAMLEE